MKVSCGVLTLGLGLAALVAVPAATAQSSYYYAGQSAGGQPLMVDLDSIETVDEYDTNFNYAVGESIVASQAHCLGRGAWTTLSDGVVHYAQSQATREMVRIVCSYSGQSSASVSIPSSAPTSSASVSIPSSTPPSSLPPTSSAPIDIAVVPAPSVPTSSSRIPSPPSPSPRISRPSAPPSSTQTALVYDPSSNVRATPNGQILCSIDTRSYINIYGQWGDWYNTDACGVPGVIHISQIQF